MHHFTTHITQTQQNRTKSESENYMYKAGTHYMKPDITACRCGFFFVQGNVRFDRSCQTTGA